MKSCEVDVKMCLFWCCEAVDVMHFGQDVVSSLTATEGTWWGQGSFLPDFHTFGQAQLPSLLIP